MPTKYYNLKPGDKADHGDGEVLTFRKMDGMYATWTNDKGEMRIGSCEQYEMKGGIYYPESNELYSIARHNHIEPKRLTQCI